MTVKLFMIRSHFLVTVLLFRMLSRYLSCLSSLSIVFSQSPPKEHKDFLLAGCTSQNLCHICRYEVAFSHDSNRDFSSQASNFRFFLLTKAKQVKAEV